MRNRKYQKLTIGGVDYSKYFHFPFMVQRALDESLDFAVIELSNTRIKEPFKPFMDVVIGSGDTALTFITAQDDVEERFGTGLYKHTITVMEKTKETERIICGAKAFTNPLVRDYTDGQTLIYLRDYSSAGGEWLRLGELHRSKNIASPTNDKQIKIINSDFHFGFDEGIMDGDLASIRVYFSPSTGNNIMNAPYDVERSDSGSVTSIKFNTDPLYSYTRDPYSDFYFSATRPGLYVITYELGSYVNFQGLIAEILVTKNPVAKDPYTLEEVTLQLLDICETIRIGLDKSRYQLRYQSAEQMTKFKKPAPEFRFSNGRSLFENLREIGRYVHAMPRIGHDTATGYDYLFFDELGGTQYADLSKGCRQFGGTASFNVGDYTGGLDSMASNLVNLDDEADGSITEPFEGGYISMRTETETARIKEDTGFIQTTYPIEKIISVQVGPFEFNGNTYEGGEIRPYVFEKNEYDILSSFSGSYPTSKTYALYYTQGSPNIQGLWYKAQDNPGEVFNAMEDYSISNILTAVTGVTSGLFKSFDYKDLIFRVTYIPSVTARVRQHKPTYDNVFPSVMVHNQSANKLAARAFGENLRGQLAMMSNVSKTVMYIFQRLEDVPKAGTLYDDDYYISSVAIRVWHDYVIAQIGLSKGYNELGGYVEINNAIRQFEIPGSEDRYTVLEEFCEIGAKSADDENLALTSNLRTEVFNAFGSQASGKDVSAAFVKTYDEDGNVIQGVPDIVLPVISLAIGNSLYFGFRFADNFGAGSQSEVGGTEYRSQKYVPYADQFYSQAHSIGFTLKYKPTIPTSLTGKIQAAHAFPEVDGITGGTDMVSTGDHPILWHKDSADAGCFTYQLHFVTNDDLIIGDGLAHHCAAVRNTPSTEPAYIYFYDHRINQLTGTTDKENYLNVYAVKIDPSNGRIYYTGTPSGFKSWAIIKGGRFMLGKNSTERPINIYFNFKRRISE